MLEWQIQGNIGDMLIGVVLWVLIRRIWCWVRKNKGETK